jgi:hypothetical protein
LAVSAVKINGGFPGNRDGIAMERSEEFHPVKRFESFYRRVNFRPLVLRVMWGINLLLFAAGFGAVIYCLRIFDQ